MRGVIDIADIAPCFHCGVDRMRVRDIDDQPLDLDPQPYDGATVQSGWWLRDDTAQPLWAVHMAGYPPGGTVAFLLHICTPKQKGTPQVTTPTFGTTLPPGASGPSMQELEGKLILVTLTAIERAISTTNGLADAVKCSVVDLTSGEVHPTAALWGKTLVPQFGNPAPGTMFVGKIIKGTPTGSQSPPWVWQPGEGADVETASRYIAYAASGNTQAPVAPPAPPVAAAPAASAPPWA